MNVHWLKLIPEQSTNVDLAEDGTSNGLLPQAGLTIYNIKYQLHLSLICLKAYDKIP